MEISTPIGPIEAKEPIEALRHPNDLEPQGPELEALGRRIGARNRKPTQLYPAAEWARLATEPRVPKSYAEAMSDPLNKAEWQAAIQEELAKLQALDTWEYTKLPAGEHTVGCKWVFNVKRTPTGLIDRYKARLVAQGFSQVAGEDYSETFSPTIRGESLRTLLAIGAYEDLEIRQIDVVSAYPCSKLHATIYMKPPEALWALEGSVLALKKALYGLKQSGREWYIEACRGLLSLGLTPCSTEPSVFVTADRSLIVGLYVDDMIILGKEHTAVDRVVQGIKALWEIKDLGDAALILGIQVNRDRQNRSLTINQARYIQSVLERFQLGDAKPVTLPATDRESLIAGNKGEALADQALYQQAIGCLRWIVQNTRFDVAYVAGQLCQHCNEPTVRHWNAALRALRYLKGTLDYATSYHLKGTQQPKLQGY